MVSRPELRHPAERCKEVSCYDAGRRPVFSRSLGRVGESHPSMFDRQTGDRPPSDLRHGPLKEGREKFVPQLILHRLKFHPYARGDALQEGPLLLEGLLQDRVCGMRVTTRHPIQGGHQFLSSLNLLPQPPCLLCLCPKESPKATDPCHNLKNVPLKEGVLPRYVPGRHNQDALGWIWKVAAQEPSHHQFVKVATYSLKGANRPSIILITGLGDAGVGRP